MSIAQMILPEFDQEMANTRKTLERVADDRLDYKPHAKSGTMGWLAAHISNLPLWATNVLESDSLDIAPVSGPGFQMPKPANRAEMLANFDRHVAETRKALSAAKDEEFGKTWSLLKGGQIIMSMPKSAVVRGFVINHIIHHRAQLTVYLRLNDVPVPALYGPSADEGAM